MSSSSCGEHRVLKIPVRIESGYSFESRVVDDTSTIATASGTYEVLLNPLPNDEGNPSTNVVRYERNGAELYDSILYSLNPWDVSLLDGLVSGEKRFYVDLLADAEAGTNIIIQLENKNAGSQSYPVGRHSRYEAIIPAGGSIQKWQTLAFKFLDRPDENETVVNQIVILFSPGSYARQQCLYV